LEILKNPRAKKVAIGYPGKVIRAIVDYCYTDHSELFQQNSTSESYVRTMVELSGAADYFELPLLSEKAITETRSIMRERPSVACVILDQTCGGNKGMSELANDALQCIRRNPSAALLPQNGLGVLSLTGPPLALIMADDEMNCDEITLFLALRRWAEGEGDDRQKTACEIAKCLRLANISPTDLCSVVEVSGLVSKDQLFQTFKNQAMYAERETDKFSKPRLNVSWQSTSDLLFTCETPEHITELLDCAVMTSGVHMWSIEVVTYCNCVWLGVAFVSEKINCDQWLGKQVTGWAYGSNGAACHNTGEDNGPYHEVHPTFDQGSVITMKLDLTAGGTLSAAVDDKPPFVLFQDMTHEQKPAFVPAVSVRGPGAVRVLSFGACKF